MKLHLPNKRHYTQPTHSRTRVQSLEPFTELCCARSCCRADSQSLQLEVFASRFEEIHRYTIRCLQCLVGETVRITNKALMYSNSVDIFLAEVMDKGWRR